MLLLITRPYYEKATHYIFHWSEPLLVEAERRHVEIIDLQKEKARKETFRSYIRKKNPDLVFLNGHGNSVAIAGQDGEIILAIGDDLSVLRGKVIFARACSAGANLGGIIIQCGARGFIGYAQPFMFPWDRDSVGKPLEDELARPCLECSNYAPTLLLRGESAEAAHEESLKKQREKIQSLLSSRTPNTFVLWFMNWNMISQVCLV